ncbi:MAG: LysM peptidoglycan-binding domain-containing protein [Actinobacteria bacterium]|nr:LysM peptidoglycan-binding domain-containing protein [Actinomycetota bacterium]
MRIHAGMWSRSFVTTGAIMFLAACGTSSTQTGATVLNLEATNWATIPTVPATLAPTATTSTVAGVPGSRTDTITEYTLVAGDNPTKVAAFYDITLDQLNAANVGTSGYSIFFVGLKIKIPVGAKIPDAGEAPGVTVPPVETCIAGEYTLLPGDFPGIVADKFDVTVKALDAVNEDTNGYGGFIVGTTINIPCAEEASN